MMAWGMAPRFGAGLWRLPPLSCTGSATRMRPRRPHQGRGRASSGDSAWPVRGTSGSIQALGHRGAPGSAIGSRPLEERHRHRVTAADGYQTLFAVICRRSVSGMSQSSKGLETNAHARLSETPGRWRGERLQEHLAQPNVRTGEFGEGPGWMTTETSHWPHKIALRLKVRWLPDEDSNLEPTG